MSNDKKLVKLYATWCGPCKVLTVRLNKLNLGDNLISIDAESEEFKKSNYPKPKMLPTVYVVNENNEILETIEGVQQAQVYLDALN